MRYRSFGICSRGSSGSFTSGGVPTLMISVETLPTRVPSHLARVMDPGSESVVGVFIVQRDGRSDDSCRKGKLKKPGFSFGLGESDELEARRSSTSIDGLSRGCHFQQRLMISHTPDGNSVNDRSFGYSPDFSFSNVRKLAMVFGKGHFPPYI